MSPPSCGLFYAPNTWRAVARAPRAESYRQNNREQPNVQKGRGAAESDPATINQKPRVVIRGPPAVTKKRGKSARGHYPAHPVRYPLALIRGPWSVVQEKRHGARGDRVSEIEARRGVQSDRAAARRSS